MRTGRFGRAGCAKKQHETLKKSIPRGQIAFAVGQRSFWCLSLEAILPPPQEPHDVLGGGRTAAKGLIIMPEVELEGGSSLRRARADRFPVNREISLQIPANQGNHLPWQNKQPFCG